MTSAVITGMSDIATEPEIMEHLAATIVVGTSKPSPFFEHSQEVWDAHRRAEQALWKMELKMWRKYRGPLKRIPLP